MKFIKYLSVLIIAFICGLLLEGCKKDETYPPLTDAVYIVSTAVTGSGAMASTTLNNTATGKVSISPATARVYVNALKNFDVTVNYTLSGTAVAGTHYQSPVSQNITIPQGKWYTDIEIPVINTSLTSDKTIIINLTKASNNTQLGLGSSRNYKSFTYTLTN